MSAAVVHQVLVSLRIHTVDSCFEHLAAFESPSKLRDVVNEYSTGINGQLSRSDLCRLIETISASMQLAPSRVSKFCQAIGATSASVRDNFCNVMIAALCGLGWLLLELPFLSDQS